MTATCSTCCYGRPGERPRLHSLSTIAVLECRRHAPSEGREYKWPAVEEDDWCGDFEQLLKPDQEKGA